LFGRSRWISSTSTLSAHSRSNIFISQHYKYDDLVVAEPIAIMANYNGPARNRVHLNNYINDLNRVPSAQDFQTSSTDAPYVGGSDDLSLWTNASFMNDFALDASADLQIGEFGYGGEHGQAVSPAVADFKPLDFEEG